MDRRPRHVARRYRRSQQHHAGARQGAHAGNRHSPRIGRSAQRHHRTDSFGKFRADFHRRHLGPHGRCRCAVGRRFDLLPSCHRRARRNGGIVAGIVQHGGAGTRHTGRRVTAGGHHSGDPGPAHQGGGRHPRRINEQITPTQNQKHRIP